MVFHSSLVGFMFVTLGWSQLVNGVGFTTSFDNWILELLFDNRFFNETLAIGGIYTPESLSAIELLFDGSQAAFPELMLGLVPGVIGSGLLILLMGAFLVYKKAINYIVPVTIIGSFLVTALIIGLVKGEDVTFPLYHLFTGGLLYVVVFVSTDPITTPIPFKGKLIFGVMVGALTMIIRNGIKFQDGSLMEPIIYAMLFMMMLTPMLNEVFKAKKKVVKKPPVNKIAKGGV